MSRALLVCPEPLGHQQPAGVGIRFLEITKQLVDRRHQVTLLTPDGAPLEGVTTGRSSPESFYEHSQKNDVAVVQGHIANDFFAHAAELPTVVDLYDPFVVENLHYSTTHRGEIYQHDLATLFRSLQHGDFFLCASASQRMFYLGLLLAVGRISPERFAGDASLESLIALAPFGVPPTPTIQRHEPSRRLLFGGIYDWYEPEIAIEAVTKARAVIADLTITFNEHPNASSTPQSKAAAVKKLASGRYADVIEIEPWTPYNERADYYARFRAAIISFPQSLETDLAMRTRVYDYLWAGLPIVTSSASGTDEMIRKYSAGVVVDSMNVNDYAEAIIEVVRTDSRNAEGAAAFALDHQWSRVLRPLLAFCDHPLIDRTKGLSKLHGIVESEAPRFIDRLRRKLGVRS